MRRLRSILTRIVTPSEGKATSDGRVYECTYCQCTAAVSRDRCRECQIGRLVPAGPDSEGVPCRTCRAVIDPRYERCPECGSARGRSAR